MLDGASQDGRHFLLCRQRELVSPGDAGERPAQPVENLQPGLPDSRGLNLPAQPGGQRADEQRHDGKDEQRDEVLDVTHRERVVGRNEEEIEGQYRGHRCDDARGPNPHHMAASTTAGRKTTALLASDRFACCNPSAAAQATTTRAIAAR